MGPRTLLVGIGSPHGDDRVGWLVARQVAARSGDALAVRCARTPSELLDWLGGLDTLIVCDAIICDRPPGTWQSWTWPASQIELAQFSGSHDLPLAGALALAAELGQLPARVQIWAMTINDAQRLSDVSAAVAAAAEKVAQQICGELCHA